MEALETLAVALGFASLAGVNLYLTVLVTGLAVHFNWVDLSTKFPDLLILGEPAVIIAAGVFAAFEFFSDKIPWVDSAWDSVHTFIRPVGGGLLALTAMGPTDPAFAVIIAMLASGASLMTHGLKSGTRIAINQSPEPVTNVTASLTEDMAVIGGLAIMSISPWAFAAICLVFITVAIIMAPRLYRRTRTFSWLLWKKLGALGRQKSESEMTLPLTEEDELLLKDLCDKPTTDVAWSLPVVVGPKRKFANLTANTFGKIFAFESDREALHCIGRKNGKHYHTRIELAELDFVYEPRFASEDIVLENNETNKRAVFRLTSGSEALVRKVITELTLARDGQLPSQQQKQQQETSTAENKSQSTV